MSDPQPEPLWRSALAATVAVAALLVFLGFTVFLFSRTDQSDLQWTRAVYLLSGVEAVTFAGIGWLFGREVHRAQAQQAQERAVRAEEQAATAGEKAASATAEAADHKARSQALVAGAEEAAAQEAAQRGESTPRGRLESGVRRRGDASTQLQPATFVADLARRLYPEYASEALTATPSSGQERPSD